MSKYVISRQQLNISFKDWEDIPIDNLDHGISKEQIINVVIYEGSPWLIYWREVKEKKSSLDDGTGRDPMSY